MKTRFVVAGLVLFASGIAVGVAAQKTDASVYQGKSKDDAGKALIAIAKEQAGDGSWERIAIGRLYYLSGAKADGQAIFDKVLADDVDASDLLRIARIYRQANEWDKAKVLLDRAVLIEPRDEKTLAEVGANYLLSGDRKTAEDLFARSFNRKSELWATISIAGAYLGVAPQE